MRNTQVKDADGNWVDGEPAEGETYRKPIGTNGWHTQKKYTPPDPT